MKTTIDFPDDLLHRAKIVAAERRVTLRKLVVTGLEKVTSEPTSTYAERKRKENLERLVQSMRASNTEPMVPLKREAIYER